MKKLNIIKLILILSLLVVLTASSCKPPKKGLRIAVAANFVATLNKLVIEFTKESGIPVTVIPGSTGKLYAQIRHGAPYDIFLAADQARPAQLVAEKRATMKFTYAVGQLVLWSPERDEVDWSILKSDISHLAMANPKLAPYGLAAKETLQALNLWEQMRHKIVTAENVSQAFQFAQSGNAELAFVSLSQVLESRGSKWLVPAKIYSPINQDACVVNDSSLAQAFIKFFRGPLASEILLASGYLAPTEKDSRPRHAH